MKKCWKCKCTKDVDEFHKKSGHCKTCSKEIGKKQRARYKVNGRPNPAIRYEYEHRDQYEMFKRARIRANNKNLPFNILPKDLTIPRYCPILGIELKKGNRKCSDLSPSIDRIIPELGYVKGNVTVISHRANTLKNSATLEESEKITNWLRAQLKISEP